MTRIRFIAAAGGLLALAASPAFAATATSAHINANASGALVSSSAGLPGVTATTPDSASGLPGAAGLHAHASLDVGSAGHDHVQPLQDVSASWSDANSGAMHIVNTWVIDTPDPTAGVVVQATTIDQSLDSSLPTWQYEFDATGTDDLFTMGFGGTVTGDSFGLGAWDLHIVDNGSVVVGLQALSRGVDFSQALVSGHHYVVTLTSNNGRALVTDGHTNNHIIGIEQSDFNWSITGEATGGSGAPEPATWALTILGFGLAGASLRRRRATLAA